MRAYPARMTPETTVPTCEVSLERLARLVEPLKRSATYERHRVHIRRRKLKVGVDRVQLVRMCRAHDVEEGLRSTMLTWQRQPRSCESRRGGTGHRRTLSKSRPSPVTLLQRKIGQAFSAANPDASSHAMPTSLT